MDRNRAVTRAFLSALMFAALILTSGMLTPFAAAKKPSPATPPDAPVKASPLLATMKTELDRSFATLSAQDPKAYFIGYAITDTQRAEVSGSNGALLSSSEMLFY